MENTKVIDFKQNQPMRSETELEISLLSKFNIFGCLGCDISCEKDHNVKCKTNRL